MRALLLLALAGCGYASLDELPSPETCKWEYDVNQVNDVTLTMELDGITEGGDVELHAMRDGRFGFAVDLRISTTDPIPFPDHVCAEVMTTANYEGPIQRRGLLFRKQADGSMLARNAIIDPGVTPSTFAPFKGLVRADHMLFPSTIFGFGTYSGLASANMTVNLVNNVGFLSDSPDQDVADASPAADGAPDATLSEQSVRSCYGQTSPYCSQFDMSGNPPANALDIYAPVWCADDDTIGGPFPCDETFNGQARTAVCTMSTTESWGFLILQQQWYGPVDEATLRPDCEARGGTFTTL